MPAFRAKGIASWYDESRFTSTGERYRAREFTAAHPSLPFGTMVAVRNLKNGRVVLVRINDRGPHKGGRIIDLSRAAASRLGILSEGLAPVELRIVPPSPKPFSFLPIPRAASEATDRYRSKTCLSHKVRTRGAANGPGYRAERRFFRGVV
ncbi:septal ring lytic transglycosylase RlpA family protein [Verrucomicrobium sp. 3C]|uniref:septal ring lytic transglycosylase RlpA family protein n=1 Tax=Verrucomicrobium sp. 3C TaxID=1134055 RepID=UPI0018CB5E57|nr:septal ring lytic transglycosylase RlpA family protein [Verrucomicrobium sp. 3C]